MANATQANLPLHMKFGAAITNWKSHRWVRETFSFGGLDLSIATTLATCASEFRCLICVDFSRVGVRVDLRLMHGIILRNWTELLMPFDDGCKADLV